MRGSSNGTVGKFFFLILESVDSCNTQQAIAEILRMHDKFNPQILNSVSSMEIGEYLP